jgi:hypothetical protein
MIDKFHKTIDPEFYCRNLLYKLQALYNCAYGNFVTRQVFIAIRAAYSAAKNLSLYIVVYSI